MPYAITLRLDANAAARVVTMWESLAVRGVSDEAIRPGYPPHLTLAVLRDTADTGRLLEAARQCVARWNKQSIKLASLGNFPGTPATLFLAPVVTLALLAMHTELLNWLEGEPIDPHYQSENWVPHVTLASDLIDSTAAAAALGPLQLPVDAVLDKVDVVRFRPVEVLASHPLRPA
jgi:2'-5' RNA ligase